MELYFLRHGDAEVALFDTARADFERNLTPYGREEMDSIAQGIHRIVEGFDHIFTSPLNRAVQTAEIIAGEFSIPPDKVEKLDALGVPPNLEDLLEVINIYKCPERILCVGHAPTLGEMATEIVTGIQDECFFPLKKGGLLCIEMDVPNLSCEAEIRYLLEPDILKALSFLEEEAWEDEDNPEENLCEEDTTAKGRERNPDESSRNNRPKK